MIFPCPNFQKLDTAGHKKYPTTSSKNSLINTYLTLYIRFIQSKNNNAPFGVGLFPAWKQLPGNQQEVTG